MRIFEEHKFDLVVTDLEMPFVSGEELVSHIRNISPTLPIVVVSSRSDEKSKVAVYALGIDEFLTKPITPIELVAKITKLLAG